MFSWRRSSSDGASDQTERTQLFARQLDRARHGEAEALSALYRQFLPGIFGTIAARVPDRATAEDLTSEVFLKMVEGISQLRANDEAGFTAWILKIAHITVAGYYRKREGQPILVYMEHVSSEVDEETEAWEIAASHPYSDPVRQAEGRDEWARVVKALNALTEEQRQVLTARLILGYDVATVARMIGKNPNAVKALQFRALNSLERLLGEQLPAQQSVRQHPRRQRGSV